jgi:sugar lactone lactonase YvrE
MSAIEVGELLYTVTLNITGMKEYGVSFAALMAGEVTPPVEGARFDVAFEGTAAGPKLNGAAEGIDYVRVRADGRFELHIHETIRTEDGQNIAAHGDGVAILRPKGVIADVRVNMTLFASSKDYTWVNQLQVRGIGTLDLAKQVIQVSAYSATITAQAWDRGKVERFATLPPGEAHPEGIAVDQEGNVYVVTVAANKPDTSEGTLLVFDPKGKHLRTVRIAGSSPWLLDLRFHPQTGQLLVIDYKSPKVLVVDPKMGASSVFMTVTGEHPGLDGLTFDNAGNVYVTDAHEGIIWRVGKEGGAATAWVTSPLLKPTRPPPAIGANGLAFNKNQTALFVANTAQDTIVKIPVSGEPLQPGTPEVFVNRAGGGPDGIIIDEDDNLWIACNQSDEIMVLEPKQGRVIAKLGDFGGIDGDGAPIGFLWSNSLVFHGDDVLVTNLSLDVGAVSSQLRTVDGPWAAAVKLHTVSKIKKRIPKVPE